MGSVKKAPDPETDGETKEESGDRAAKEEERISYGPPTKKSKPKRGYSITRKEQERRKLVAKNLWKFKKPKDEKEKEKKGDAAGDIADKVKDGMNWFARLFG